MFTIYWQGKLGNIFCNNFYFSLDFPPQVWYNTHILKGTEKKREYCNINLRGKSLSIIATSNSIIEEFEAKGYDLTLRQLYYQFIARDLFPENRRWVWTGSRWKRDPNGTKNAEPNYKWIGGLINNGRLIGLVDWKSIVDRTRKFLINNHWDSPTEIIEDATGWYAIDTRADQDFYVEVWVEKDALVGVIEQACDPLDIGYLSCRGFVSQSAMWRAAMRLRRKESKAASIILHLGDHDPSGIDMTRDIQDRLKMFGSSVAVERIALNMNQIKKYNPPPNYAKTTDSRYADYASKYGDDSWELDALDPQIITELIEKKVASYTDESKREILKERQEKERKVIQDIADSYEE